MKKGALIAAVLLCLAVPASAQDGAYVAGIGGLTFQSATAGLVGAEAGVHLTPNVVVFGQAGLMFDVLPRSVRDDLDDAVVTLEQFTGQRLEFDAKVQATYVGGGVKYLIPLRTHARPYILGGVGAVTYKGSLRERELGDVLDQAIALGAIDEDDVRGTEVGYEIGGGVMVPAGRAQLDAGYRLLNVKGVNISRVALGIGLKF